MCGYFVKELEFPGGREPDTWGRCFGQRATGTGHSGDERWQVRGPGAVVGQAGPRHGCYDRGKTLCLEDSGFSSVLSCIPGTWPGAGTTQVRCSVSVH